MLVEGLEPPKPKRLIYSQVTLTSSALTSMMFSRGGHPSSTVGDGHCLYNGPLGDEGTVVTRSASVVRPPRETLCQTESYVVRITRTVGSATGVAENRVTRFGNPVICSGTVCHFSV